MRRWRRANPERVKAICRRANAKRATRAAADARERRRRKRAALIAQPRITMPPRLRDAGLSVVLPRSIGDRRDAEQDRILAELEKQAARRKAA